MCLFVEWSILQLNSRSLCNWEYSEFDASVYKQVSGEYYLNKHIRYKFDSPQDHLMESPLPLVELVFRVWSDDRNGPFLVLGCLLDLKKDSDDFNPDRFSQIFSIWMGSKLCYGRSKSSISYDSSSKNFI